MGGLGLRRDAKVVVGVEVVGSIVGDVLVGVLEGRTRRSGGRFVALLMWRGVCDAKGTIRGHGELHRPSTGLRRGVELLLQLPERSLAVVGDTRVDIKIVSV